MIEREVKLGVWPGFVLPDLDGVVEGATSVAGPERHLDATYYDTPDLRLARAGITVRHRVGDDPAWTLKLPAGDSLPGGLSRDELPFSGNPRAGVPQALAGLLTARVRTAPLVAVARLRTTRRPVDVLDEEGKPLAEIVDDEVSVLEGRRVALRFREVEVEIDEGASAALLEEVLARLRAAGAGLPDPTPKVMRALGPLAFEPPELVVGSLPDAATAAEVLAAGLTRSVDRLIAHDLGIRSSDDAEHVHQARVATRRLRSDLRTYGELVDADWATGLRDELAWLAGVLGHVRDADVLLVRLAGHRQRLEARDHDGHAALAARLEAERATAVADLQAALSSPRYAELLDRLVDAAVQPRTLASAAQPAATVLPRLAERPWRALAKAADGINRSSSDEALHRVRIRAKRARYAADVAALVVGKPARRLSGAIAGVQEVLGEHQDACTARAWLREAAAGAPDDVALVAGQLLAIERSEAEARRAEWPAAWSRASKGRLRTWLKP